MQVHDNEDFQERERGNERETKSKAQRVSFCHGQTEKMINCIEHLHRDGTMDSKNRSRRDVARIVDANVKHSMPCEGQLETCSKKTAISRCGTTKRQSGTVGRRSGTDSKKGPPPPPTIAVV